MDLLRSISRAGSARVWAHGYTELFFLDEVTALAAGHRPCFECRRADALAFAASIAAEVGSGRARRRWTRSCTRERLAGARSGRFAQSLDAARRHDDCK